MTASAQPEAVGVLGGTFDPVHRGHLRMATAAQQACGLRRVYFVPATHPWHKRGPRASFADRYAMVALALAGRSNWMPLYIPEPAGAAPGPGGRGASAPPATYSVDQVAWLRRHHPRERIFFILGADAFLTLPTWKQYRRLLAACDFVVLARGAVTLPQILAVLPPGGVAGVAGNRIRLNHGSSIHWLAGFRDRTASTTVRAGLAAAGPNASRQPELPAPVDAYARRGHLYE